MRGLARHKAEVNKLSSIYLRNKYARQGRWVTPCDPLLEVPNRSRGSIAVKNLQREPPLPEVFVHVDNRFGRQPCQYTLRLSITGDYRSGEVECCPIPDFLLHMRRYIS